MTYGIRALYRLPSHPLLFPLKSLSSGVKKIKSGIFFAEIQKIKTCCPPFLLPTAVCFFLNFCKKYTTFDFFTPPIFANNASFGFFAGQIHLKVN